MRLVTGGGGGGQPHRVVPPTARSAEVVAAHQADADITARKCSGGYAWLEATW